MNVWGKFFWEGVKWNLIAWAAIFLFFFSFLSVNSSEAVDETENLSKQAEVVWSRFDGQNQGVYYSALSASGWSDPLKLSGASERNRLPSVCSGNDGSSWAVWTSERDSESDLYYAFSSSGKWTEPTKISTGMPINMAPSLVLDQENRPWIVWAGGNGDGSGSDIICSHWNGSDWEQPLRVNTADATPDILPLIGIEQGVPWVCWFGFDGSRYRVYYSRWSSQGWSDEVPSDDGGLYANLMNMREQSITPSLPGFISDPESACVYVRNRGPLKAIPFRYFGLEGMLGIEARNMPEMIGREESASGDLAILGFGDSITQGYPYITTVGDGRRVGGYEPVLETLMTADSRPSQVLNWGVGGEKSFQGVNRIDSVLTDPTADYILILEGTNDFNKNFSWISWGDTINNLGIMIDKSLAQNITPIISTLTPDTVVDGFAKDVIIREQYNPGIKDLAVSKGVILADQYQGLIANWKVPTDPCTGYTCDGLHPNEAGYAAMAQIWYSVIPGPPMVTTTAAGPVGFTTAVLDGTVNPNGVSTQYHFEYGETTSYGSTTTGINAGSGTGVSAVNDSVTGLAFDTLYHFRMVATSSAGTSYGDDLTFTTHISSCDECEGDIVILKNVVFSAGTACECVAGTSITIENVTIESGADIRFKAPQVDIIKKFNAKNGSLVSIKQN